MATATDVRAWAKEQGRGQTRGKLPGALITDWDTTHPDDPYEPGPPREPVNGHAPDYPGDPDDFDAQFPEPPDLGDTGETPPSKPRARARAARAAAGTRSPGTRRRPVTRRSSPAYPLRIFSGQCGAAGRSC